MKDNKYDNVWYNIIQYIINTNIWNNEKTKFRSIEIFEKIEKLVPCLGTYL